MGIFRKLFGKKENQHDSKPGSNESLLQDVEVAPGIALPKVLLDYWPALSQTKRTFIAVQATPADELSFRESKLYHYPCIPEGFSYPTGSNGKFMIPLAQINCTDYPLLNNFPASGYLQFYFSDNDIYGLNLDNQQEQLDFRVLYFKEEEVVNPQKDFAYLTETMQSEYSPVYQPLKLSFEIKESYAGAGDIHADKILVPMLAEIAAKYPEIEDDVSQIVYDRFSANGHKLGGYAYFTQTDPRKYRKEWEDYILLFQIDSDDHIMWGDVGVANFFIHPTDLANLDFTKVIYNWDCS